VHKDRLQGVVLAWVHLLPVDSRLPGKDTVADRRWMAPAEEDRDLIHHSKISRGQDEDRHQTRATAGNQLGDIEKRTLGLPPGA
jgi:hypothetical protein